MYNPDNEQELQLSYVIQDHGWARIRLTSGEKVWEGDAGYCQDTLGDLVRAALLLAHGGQSATIRIDPEGIISLLTITNDSVTIIENGEKSKVAFETKTPWHNFSKEVVRVASDIFENIGADEYLKKWIEHPFPTRELEILIEKQNEINARF